MSAALTCPPDAKAGSQFEAHLNLGVAWKTGRGAFEHCVPAWADSITEFKRRHCFERWEFPRDYIPLTPKETLALWLGLHHGWVGALPQGVLMWLLGPRSRYYGWSRSHSQVQPGSHPCPKRSDGAEVS